MCTSDSLTDSIFIDFHVKAHKVGKTLKTRSVYLSRTQLNSVKKNLQNMLHWEVFSKRMDHKFLTIFRRASRTAGWGVGRAPPHSLTPRILKL